MPILTIGLVIISILSIGYLGTNLLMSFAFALLIIAVAGIVSVIAYKLIHNMRNNCDVFNFKKCSK